MDPSTWTEYDGYGRLAYADKLEFGGGWSRVTELYDVNGNLSQKSNPFDTGTSTPPTTNYVYDELGRVVKTTYPDTSTSTNNYQGPEVITTNGLGQTTTLYKDGHSNVLSVTDAISKTLNYSYDGFDQRTLVTDPAGNQTKYVFDIRGRTISGVDPDKGAWASVYNSFSDMTASCDANHGASTSSACVSTPAVTYTYDQLSRMTSRTEPDLVSNWTYDTSQYGVGELASETVSGTASPSGQSGTNGYTRTITYDSLGRVSTDNQSQPAPWSTSSTQYDWSETYTYDSYGRLSLSCPYAGTAHCYGVNYTTSGYVNGYYQAQQIWWPLAEDPAGNPTSVQYGPGSNGLMQTFTYDLNTERETSDTVSTDTSSPQQLLAFNNITYDVLGNMLKRSSNFAAVAMTGTPASSFTENYTYDSLNRLISVTGPVAKAVCYDTGGLGNIAYKSDIIAGGATTGNDAASTTNGTCPSATGNGLYSYSGSGAGPHAVTSITGVSGTFTYDADGNMLTGNGRTITYTSFGMVKSVTENGETVTYSYGPEHQRLAQTKAGSLSTVDTVYRSGYDVTSSNGGTNTSVRHYVINPWGQRVGELYFTGTGALPSAAATISFYLNDWQNSVSEIVAAEANGNPATLTEADSFDAWGKRRFVTGLDDNNNTVNSAMVRGYTNQEHVFEVELIDLNARMYDPHLGKMLSVDPAVTDWLDPQTWNAYSYARDNPMTYTDPTGEDYAWWDECGNGDPSCSVVAGTPANADSNQSSPTAQVANNNNGSSAGAAPSTTPGAAPVSASGSIVPNGTGGFAGNVAALDGTSINGKINGNVIDLFPQGSAQDIGMQHVTPGQNEIDVGAHGNPVNMVDATGKVVYPIDLANLIKSMPGYDAATLIRLYSCNTGVVPGGVWGNKSFGESLALDLGVGRTVAAPNNFGWITTRGGFSIGPDKLPNSSWQTPIQQLTGQQLNASGTFISTTEEPTTN